MFEYVKLYPIDSIPYQPVRVEEVPYYRMEDVDLYGLPDLWGILNYHVIDCADISCPQRLEHRDEVQLALEGRNIHRYSRYMRFKYTIDRLCGRSRVIIPDEVTTMIQDEIVDTRPEYIWDSIRFLLKKHGYKKFYDRIPCIIRLMGHPGRIHMTDRVMQRILRDFMEMEDAFNELKGMGLIPIKYFPNLRYIALKLMEKHNVAVDYYIPFIRVKKVYEKLEPIRELMG